MTDTTTAVESPTPLTTNPVSPPEPKIETTVQSPATVPSPETTTTNDTENDTSPKIDVFGHKVDPFAVVLLILVVGLAVAFVLFAH